MYRGINRLVRYRDRAIFHDAFSQSTHTAWRLSSGARLVSSDCVFYLQVTWYHGESAIEETALTTIEDSQGWCYVKRKHMQPKDAGVYRVTAENVAGFDEAQFSVAVQGRTLLEKLPYTYIDV